MNIKMTGLRSRWLSTSLRPCALDESSLSIGRVMLIEVKILSDPMGTA